MANATIQIRTDAMVKEAVDSIFSRLGITMSDGINIFLRQVQIHQGFPFEVRLSQPPSIGKCGQTTEERLAYIRSMAGKYEDCAFSTEQLLEERQHGKEHENAKRLHT